MLQFMTSLLSLTAMRAVSLNRLLQLHFGPVNATAAVFRRSCDAAAEQQCRESEQNLAKRLVDHKASSGAFNPRTDSFVAFEGAKTSGSQRSKSAMVPEFWGLPCPSRCPKAQQALRLYVSFRDSFSPVLSVRMGELAVLLVLGFTLGDDGLMEFVADGIGKGINVVVAVDFDGLAGSVANDETVVAPLKVLF